MPHCPGDIYPYPTIKNVRSTGFVNPLFYAPVHALQHAVAPARQAQKTPMNFVATETTDSGRIYTSLGWPYTTSLSLSTSSVGVRVAALPLSHKPHVARQLHMYAWIHMHMWTHRCVYTRACTDMRTLVAHTRASAVAVAVAVAVPRVGIACISVLYAHVCLVDALALALPIHN